MADYVYRVDIPSTEGAISMYPLTIPETVGVALRVLAGDYGNGEERIRKLKAYGYDYQKVQKCVNDLVKLFDRYGD